MGAISPPELLTSRHSVEQFNSGRPSIDRWLKKHGLSNQESRASRTYVVCASKRVVGYYALSAASIERQDAHRSLRHGEPDPIPAILLGRLGVDREFQGQGVGSGLLRDAFFRAQQVSESVGARLLLLDALDDAAKAFYVKMGFKQSPIDKLQLMHSLRLG